MTAEFQQNDSNINNFHNFGPKSSLINSQFQSPAETKALKTQGEINKISSFTFNNAPKSGVNLPSS